MVPTEKNHCVWIRNRHGMDGWPGDRCGGKQWPPWSNCFWIQTGGEVCWPKNQDSQELSVCIAWSSWSSLQLQVPSKSSCQVTPLKVRCLSCPQGWTSCSSIKKYFNLSSKYFSTQNIKGCPKTKHRVLHHSHTLYDRRTPKRSKTTQRCVFIVPFQSWLTTTPKMYEIVKYLLTSSNENSRTWSNYVRQLSKQYGLEDPLILLR